jgi:hypothetical protein
MYKRQQRDVHFTIAELRLRTLAMFHISFIRMHYFIAHLLSNDRPLKHDSGPTDDDILAFYS